MSPRFAILNPCHKTWADLHGDGRQRYCEACRTSVHAVEQYSPDEWARLWRDSKGRACGFLYPESLPAPRSRRAVLIGALLTTISPLMAQAGRVRIRVMDPIGAAMPTAQATLSGRDGKPIRTAQANEKGEIVFMDLPIGDSHIAVFAMGFHTSRLTVTVRNGDEVQVETTLGVGIIGEFVTVKPRPWWRRIFR